MHGVKQADDVAWVAGRHFRAACHFKCAVYAASAETALATV
jgi:hypothetical protein